MTGSGTQGNPYIIYNVTDLQNVNNDKDAWYELANDIDASATSGWNGGDGFYPLGGHSATGFEGHFDGKGYTISDLFIDRNSEYVGLFGGIKNTADVKNVNLVDADITTGDKNWAGGIAGWNEGTIEACSVTGSVTSDRDEIGGLVGYNKGTISKSYSEASVSGDRKCGGFVGRHNDGQISDCYARGSVSGSEDPGGFIGENRANVDRCYSTGYVTGSGKGGFVATSDGGDCDYCYWDTQTSGCSSSDGGTGKTTSQMKQQSTFSTWNFSTVWKIVQNITPGLLQPMLCCKKRQLRLPLPMLY